MQYSDEKWFHKPLQNDLNNHLTSHTVILKTLQIFLKIGDNWAFVGGLRTGHIFCLVSRKDTPYLNVHDNCN